MAESSALKISSSAADSSMSLLSDRDSARQFLTGLYAAFFDRPPDEQGFRFCLSQLEAGIPPHEIVAACLKSSEFELSIKRKALPAIELPNMTTLCPQMYLSEGNALLYVAEDDNRINFMEEAIRKYGYYDRFGAWSFEIDEDKKRIAQLVECCGARSCLEVGCFNGPILSLLKDRGIEVAGIDLSHLAFVVAFPNIRQNLLWGDLLTVEVDRRFDCIVALDVLEHVNPLAVSRHIGRIKALLADAGVAIVNSPMFGHDDIFGTVFPQYIKEWIATGDRDFFRHWPCDPQGWPIHGHMVLGSPKWWERRFAGQGLARLKELEAALQEAFVDYFTWGPYRKSLFVLGHAGARIDCASIIAAVREKAW